MDSKQVFIVLISIFLLAVAQNSSKDTGAAKEEDYVLVPDNPSPCLRPCRKDTPPMECRYKFIVENYQSLGRACHDCPRNQTDCLRPHCVPAEGTSRTVVTVNRNMPGPAIQVCLGDRIKVLVENHMAVEETSIHWHGLHQRNTPYMDGVPFVTQCPIPTGTSFEYSFVAEQIGTWVWHSHSGNQRGDGLYGALIVRQPYDNDFHNKLYDYDQPEHLMVVTDWTQTPVHELYVNNFITGSLIPLTTILVNGVGYFYDSTSKAGIPPPRFHVQKGFRYRFRLINPEFMMCPIEVSVDNHTMTVISMDGMDNEPITDMDATIKRKRSSNFSSKEENILIEIAKQYKNILECKQSNTDAYKLKKECWLQIEKKYNSQFGEIYRDSEVLRKKYENMKKNTKKKYADEKCYRQGTGGGPPLNDFESKLNSTDANICEILGNRLDGFHSEFDGDKMVQGEDFCNKKDDINLEAIECDDSLHPINNSEILILDDVINNANIFESSTNSIPVSLNGSSCTEKPDILLEMNEPEPTCSNWGKYAPSMMKASKTKNLLSKKSSKNGNSCNTSKILTNKITSWAESKSEFENIKIKCFLEEHKQKMMNMEEIHKEQLRIMRAESEVKIKIMQAAHDSRNK